MHHVSHHAEHSVGSQPLLADDGELGNPSTLQSTWHLGAQGPFTMATLRCTWFSPFCDKKRSLERLQATKLMGIKA